MASMSFDVYEALKDALKLAQKANNMEIQRALMDVQQQALDLQEENRKLRAHVDELEKALAFSGELEFDGRFYVKHPFRNALCFASPSRQTSRWYKALRRERGDAHWALRVSFRRKSP
jgi:hypothetical protein